MNASDIIHDKLSAYPGGIRIRMLRGDPCVVKLSGDNKTFESDKLPFQHMEFSVFDIIVDCLKAHRGYAEKGGARSSKVGYGACGKDTVMYAIATKYYGKKDGESCFDPLFVLAAILEWAGIVINGRGYLLLIRG